MSEKWERELDASLRKLSVTFLGKSAPEAKELSRNNPDLPHEKLNYFTRILFIPSSLWSSLLQTFAIAFVLLNIYVTATYGFGAGTACFLLTFFFYAPGLILFYYHVINPSAGERIRKILLTEQNFNSDVSSGYYNPEDKNTFGT